MRLDEKGLPLTVMTLAWPVVLQSGAASIFALIIILFIGRLGPAAIAAVSLGETIVHLPTIALAGLTVAVVAIGARRVGAGEYEQAGMLVGQSMLLAFFMGLLFSVLLWFSADLLLSVFRAAPDVAVLGRDYIRVNALATVPLFLMSCGIAVLHALGNTRTPMIVAITVEAVGVGLAYVLITGFRDVPALGVLGAGVTRAVCSTIGAAIVLPVLIRGRTPVKFDVRKALVFCWTDVIRILRIGLPALAEQMATQGAMNVYVIIISSMGTTIYAGHALAMKILGFTYVPLNGLATALGIVVGQSLGASRPDLAKKGGYLALRYCVVVMACLGLATFLLARQLTGLFTADPEVARIGALGLKMWAIAMPVVATSLTLASGLRGAGDTRGVFVLTAAGMWVVRVGVGALTVFALPFGIVGAWASAILDQAIRAVLMSHRFGGGRWQNIQV